jgi:hypothetical protein
MPKLEERESTIDLRWMAIGDYRSQMIVSITEHAFAVRRVM